MKWRERWTRNVTSIRDVLLVLRILAWLAAMPILKRVVPVRTLGRAMHLRPAVSHRDYERERRILTFARWGARLIRWSRDGNCLERGLVAYRYLGQAGANPALMVGVGRTGESLMGHAWVIVDGIPMGECESRLASYTPVFVIAADGSVSDPGRQPIQPVAHTS